MKTGFLPILFAASLFASCKKSDKAPEPPVEFIQLQQYDFGEGSLHLQYNEQHLLSRAEIHYAVAEGGTPVIAVYVNWTYQSGLPVKAEFFVNNNNAFKKNYDFYYNTDGGKKFAYVARIRLNDDGSIRRKDTVNYTFDEDNKLIFTKERVNDAVAIPYDYDNNGNHKRETESYRSGNNIYEDRFEFQYDNKINPLAVNGLGVMLYTVFGEELFEMPQVLSTNNLSNSKYTYTIKSLNEAGETTNTVQYKTDKAYTNAFDEAGGLKQVNINAITQTIQNGTVTDNGDWQSVFKFTCVKKQQ